MWLEGSLNLYDYFDSWGSLLNLGWVLANFEMPAQQFACDAVLLHRTLHFRTLLGIEYEFLETSQASASVRIHSSKEKRQRFWVELFERRLG